MVSSENDTVFVWPEGNMAPTRNISGNISRSSSVFVTDADDIYIENQKGFYRVDRWSINSTSSETVFQLKGVCSSVFVDLNDSIYCSLTNIHVIMRKLSNSTVNNSITVTVAGTQCAGPYANTLTLPTGIFVNVDFTLYVADTGNHRIQRFVPGQLNGTTVAGNGAPNTIALISPRGVTLDGDGYVFIVDSVNSRIVGSGPNGFRCVAACTGIRGSGSKQLYLPVTMSFDSYGNMFVSDTSAHRIQKFILSANYCGEFN